MRAPGLVRRSFGSPGEFLRFVDGRATALIAAGAGGVAAGLLLIALVPASTGVKIWFAAISLAGATLGYAGWQARSLTSSVRGTLGTEPAQLLLTTVPYTPVRGPAMGLRALLSSDPPGFAAEFRVAWGSFRAEAVELAPARVYGPRTSNSPVLVECGEGYALGRIGRSALPAAERPTTVDPFGTLS